MNEKLSSQIKECDNKKWFEKAECKFWVISDDINSRQSESLKTSVIKIVNNLKSESWLSKITYKEKNWNIVISRTDYPNFEWLLMVNNKEWYCRIWWLEWEFKIEDAIRIVNFTNLLRWMWKIENKKWVIIQNNTFIDTTILKNPKRLNYFTSIWIDLNKLKEYCSKLDEFQNEEKRISTELNSLSNEILLNNFERIEVKNEYYVILKYKKSSITLDLDTHIENALKSTKQVIRISREQYEDYKNKKWTVLSSEFDWVTLLTDLELNSYKVIINWVNTTSIITAYDKNWKPYNITNIEESLNKIKENWKQVHKKIYWDYDIYYLWNSKWIEKKLKRYILKLEIKNSSFSLDLFKHLRNSLNAHEIEMEVPEEVYKQFKKWQLYNETNVNIMSFLLSWRVWNMKVKVIDKIVKNN